MAEIKEQQQQDVQALPKPTASSDTTPPPPRPEPVKRSEQKSGGKTLAFLSLLVGLGALGLSGYQFYQDRLAAQKQAQTEQVVRQRLFENAKTERDNQIFLNAALQQAKEAQNKANLLESRVIELSRAYSETKGLFENVSQLSKSREAWHLAELEQLITIANQQLQLFGDLRAAVRTLEVVNQRLNNLDKPELIQLRKMVSDALTQLNNTNNLDIVTLSTKIDALIQQVEALPLVTESQLKRYVASHSAQSKKEEWINFDFFTELGSEIWGELKSLVQIHQMEDPQLTLLRPDQTFFVRENLKLRLLSARIALLQRQEKIYTNDLQLATVYVNKYYDLKQAKTKEVANQINGLKQVKFNTILPDLSNAVLAIRTLRSEANL